MLFLSFFLLQGALFVGSQPEGGAGTPENITVQIIDSKTVEVFWSTTWKNVERYDVTYNPTEDRVVSQAAGNSQSIVLRELHPNTQYQVTVTAVVGGKNYRSRRLVFRTANVPNDTVHLEVLKPVPTKPSKTRKSYPVTPEVINPDPTAVGSKYTPQTSTTVRGVEIGLVLLALVVWIIAIALFFHRWGKIRMLLPYQPDYKTQQSLKVPGTGTTIVSGCTGNSTTQGQQEGPGCVQHLRWSSRYFDEQSTAKKCSPTRWTSRPRVSSAIFPASPSFFYARTSVECESPRMIRHAHSHQEFLTETIPLCQVNQPRSESPDHNVISINVPVIASHVNEKKGVVDLKKSLEMDKSEGKDEDGCLVSEDDNDDSFRGVVLSTHYPKGIRSKWQQEKLEKKSPESQALFFIESNELQLGKGRSCHFQEPAEAEATRTSEKPRRYNRSSLKKQKIRLCDDVDPKNVPTFELTQVNNPDEAETGNDSNRKTKDMKTAEMRRKAFLRKISLQDTYVNYNQDYWLDFKNSGRYHKSVDLGCVGSDESSVKTPEVHQSKRGVEGFLWPEPFARRCNKEPEAITRQSILPSKTSDVNRCDSDPVVFSSIRCNCKNCTSDCKTVQTWLPSNENITLFSDRNGRIETDFDVLNDMLDEECLLKPETEADHDVFLNRTPVRARATCETEPTSSSVDFSNFYEVQLTGNEIDSEPVKRSAVFNFQGGQAFFGENLHSTSEDSDIFFNETEPVGLSEDVSGVPVCSSYSPPKSNPH